MGRHRAGAARADGTLNIAAGNAPTEQDALADAAVVDDPLAYAVWCARGEGADRPWFDGLLHRPGLEPTPEPARCRRRVCAQEVGLQRPQSPPLRRRVCRVRSEPMRSAYRRWLNAAARFQSPADRCHRACAACITRTGTKPVSPCSGLAWSRVAPDVDTRGWRSERHPEDVVCRFQFGSVGGHSLGCWQGKLVLTTKSSS